MKIKELHLRNIASIEKADIDFEKGLSDGVTGDPASVFLISGDTGAGKSVILDGISMALYKTTPRISSVANKKLNTFSDTNGEIISICDIEQYTRLGISEKDESYSELVFDGNDGKEYTARLTLGMMKSHTNKATGKRVLKYRTPAWSVNGLTKDADIIAAIKTAVGLTFEQFGRMAMLAQGQFASFLTGDKKERESILEQLTNTEHFTVYGIAIKSLYDAAVADHNSAKEALKRETEHTLSKEQLVELNADKTKAEATKIDIDKKTAINQGRIDQVRLIAASQKALAEASAAKQSLIETMNSNEYKDAATMTEAWAATAEQRRLLADLRKAGNGKTEALEAEKALQETYTQLSADLMHRQCQARDTLQAIKTLGEWIADRRDRDALYTNAAALDVKIGNYTKTRSRIADNKQLTKQEQAKTENLEGAYSAAKKAAADAVEDVNRKQQEISKLTEARQQLNPEQTNKDISTARDRKAKLERLKTTIQDIEKSRAETDEAKKQIEKDETALKELENVKTTARTEYDTAYRNHEETRNLLSTMEMSLDDKIVVLRHRLVDEKADTCPLCGQHISEIDIKEDFNDILTPLKQKEKEAKVQLDKAQKKLNEADSEYSKAQGALSAKKASQNKILADLRTKEKSLDADAEEVGMDTRDDLRHQIEEGIKATDSTIDELSKRQQEIVDITKDIDRLLDDKKPLDKAKTEADKKETTAKKALDDNTAEIATLQKEAARLTEELNALSNEITAAIGAAYPDWSTDTESCRTALKNDAGQYNKAKEKLAKDKAEYDVSHESLQNIESQYASVSEKHPDWKAATEPQPCQATDIKGAWSKLAGDVQSTATKIEGYDATIAECTKALDSYYEATGRQESDLDEISARADEIDRLTKLVSDTNQDLKSRNDAIAAEQRKIEEAKAKLGVEADEDIPAIEDLEQQKAALASELEATVSMLGSIEAQLKADRQNVEKVKEAEAELHKAQKKFEKWHKLNSLFGGTRLRTLVQTYILRPLLNNANIYLEKITDRYTLTCCEDNDQLSILVLDRYNKNQMRSATVLSGGERFMISLALSLALSSLNRPDMNVNILFIDEGFGTLDEKNLDSVMQTLERLQEIAGESKRRVGIISHREELDERIPVQIQVLKKGEGRSIVKIKH